MLGRIDLLTLLVDDVRRSATFYRDVLGFQPAAGYDQLDDSYVEFAHEGVRFSLCARRVLADLTGDPSYSERRTGQVIELALRLDDAAAVDATFEGLIQKGARPVTPPARMHWGQYTACLADPENNIFEIFTELPVAAATPVVPGEEQL